MICIPVSEEQVRACVRSLVPDWPAGGRWRRVKPAFLDFQSSKCAYCERPLGGAVDRASGHRDTYEQDTEHYRPYREVEPWRWPARWPGGPPLLHGPIGGYRWLELDELNYLCSCQTCNRGYKKNYFPIRRPHPDYASAPSTNELQVEEPYLLFPMEFGGVDPADFIQFFGWEAIPHSGLATDSKDYWRARITIELVGLNRIDLLNDRREVVFQLARDWAERYRSDGEALTRSESLLARPQFPASKFTSCARCFVTLCRAEPAQARDLGLQAASKIGNEPGREALELLWPAM